MTPLCVDAAVREIATLEVARVRCYYCAMLRRRIAPTIIELQTVLRPFCQKHRIRRLEVFGSVASGAATFGSDVDLLVTLDKPRPTADLLEMAGEAEELVGAPVDFVLRGALEQSPNQFAREEILASAVSLYGS
jgi:uncharacterized protein